MHIDIIGSGSPLLLMHGWAMHGGVFMPLVERLRHRFQCWIVDLPGHGNSSEDPGADLSHSVERLLAQVPAGTRWLGWSLGGQLALDAALQAPHEVGGVALIASSPCFVRRADWPHGVDDSVFTGFASELKRDYAATIERFLALEVHGDDAARSELRSLRAMWASRPAPRPEVLNIGLNWLAHRDYRARLRDLAVPSLWLSGARDRLVPPEAMRWASEASGGSYAQWPAGHAPFLAHGDAIAAAIVRWALGKKSSES